MCEIAHNIINLNPIVSTYKGRSCSHVRICAGRPTLVPGSASALKACFENHLFYPISVLAEEFNC